MKVTSEHPRCILESPRSLLQIYWDESCWQKFHCCFQHLSNKTCRFWSRGKPGALTKPGKEYEYEKSTVCVIDTNSAIKDRIAGVGLVVWTWSRDLHSIPVINYQDFVMEFCRVFFSGQNDLPWPHHAPSSPPPALRDVKNTNSSKQQLSALTFPRCELWHSLVTWWVATYFWQKFTSYFVCYPLYWVGLSENLSWYKLTVFTYHNYPNNC